MKNFITSLLCCCAFIGLAQDTSPVEVLTRGTQTSLRGLSVVNKNVIWASGSDGYFARSTDGGAHFHFEQIYNYDKAELRDIHAFDSSNAIVMSSVQPACILKTKDGGHAWKKVFEDTSSAAFFDGIDFWDDKRGICFGDPVNNIFQLYLTSDGGESWQKQNGPHVLEGTAAFAASGSSIQCLKDGKVYIATGGTQALLFYSDNYGQSWKQIETPMQAGYQSSGIFSIDFLDEKNGCITGGDYTRINSVTDNFYYTTNGGKTWNKAVDMPAGYRSGVKYIDDYFLISCGTSGADAAYTEYYKFRTIDKNSYNVVATDPKRKIVFLAGDKGLIARLNR